MDRRSPVRAERVRHADLGRLGGKVDADGGSVRVLQGGDHGLGTSVFESRVPPGSGPQRHRHPHAEVFVLHEGQGRFEVEGTSLDAEAGDVVIVPPDAWHSFTNTGPGTLRHTAIHEGPRATTEFEDGSRRD